MNYQLQNMLVITVCANNASVVSREVRHSNDAQRDAEMMTSFLELEAAYRLRSVEIKGHQIGSLWVTSNPPEPQGFIDREFTTLNGMQRMLNYVISRCLAGGFVATVDLVPEKNTHRMGGYTMVGNVRKGRGLVQQELEEPCRVVRATNYPDRLFKETFVSEVMPRFEAYALWKKLMGERAEDAVDYFKIEPDGYQLQDSDF